MPFAVMVGAVVVGNLVYTMIGNGLEKLHPYLVRLNEKLNVAPRPPKGAE